ASRRIQGELALEAVSLSRWPSLSPGERRRWQVGAALAARPEILILDEPTDHLDADARELLAGALSRFRHRRVARSRAARTSDHAHHPGSSGKRANFPRFVRRGEARLGGRGAR